MMFKGDGESACLAVARYTNDIIGSSNLSDIQSYCKMHTIDYLKTMDFLCEALKNKIMTETECDAFIQRIKAVKGKLPVNKMQDFECKNL